MENINVKNILQILSKGGVGAVLLFIIFYFGNNFLSLQREMQRDLASIRLEITKIQASVLSPEQVEKMIDTKIKLLQYHYHNKQCPPEK